MLPTAVSPILLVIIPLAIDRDFMVTYEPQPEMNLSIANITVERQIQ